MTKEIFMILNLALACYNVGTIWAHEADIFRSWKLLDSGTFHAVQQRHWKTLPYWVFIPVGVSFAASLALFWYRPGSIPAWEILAAFLVQLLSHIFTAVFWGPWQAKLAADTSGGQSRWLHKILKTHWARTLLISAYGFMLLCITIQMLSAHA